VAPGPGYFSIELAKLGSYGITGMDISRTFVAMAAKSASAAGVRVDFRQGSASNMPLQKDSFDFLLCRAAFKNFADPVGALQEMCRVLKPGRCGLIIDLKRNADPETISQHVDGMGLSWFNRIMTKMAFKGMLLKSAYTREEFEQMLAQTEFSKVSIEEGDMGLEISMTK
jgi:ubiquinone/menaquinone biosynthesis C-methylase UbiE